MNPAERAVAQVAAFFEEGVLPYMLFGAMALKEMAEALARPEIWEVYESSLKGARKTRRR